MRYREYRPTPALAPFVRVLWTLEQEGQPPSADRIFPDGCMEVVFHLGTPFRALDAAGRERVQPHALLVGQMTTALRVRPSAQARVVGIRFRPGGVFPFVRVPQHELLGALPALDDVWPVLARERDRLGELPDMGSVVARIEAVLARAVAGIASPDPRIASGAIAIERSGGSLPIDRLAAACGLGPRQLERLFRERVGMGPKRLARIVRFQAALRAQEAGASAATAAQAAGYADQAHFAREFRAIAGVTPRSFAAGDDMLAAAFAGARTDVGIVQAADGPRS